MAHQKRQTATGSGTFGGQPIPKQISIPTILLNPSLLKDMQPLLDAQKKGTTAGRFMGSPEACKFGAVRPRGGLNLTSL